MKSISRRNFLAASAVAAGLVGLAGCDNPGSSSEQDDVFVAPSADSYPIDPDGEDIAALWTSEEVRDGWTRVTNPDGGAELGVMDSARIIQVSGLAFRDMDGDGKLSLFEDWRQSNDDRAADLASKLSAEECMRLMWHGGVADSTEGATDPEYGLIEKGSCAGVNRLYANKDSYVAAVSWINEVQGRCEKRPWGIPYLNSSDPYPTMGLPANNGLAPAMDKDFWRKVGMWVSRAWRTTGTRIKLGPQVDLYSNPVVQRLSGAESEDPAVVRDFVRSYGAGMQSTWGDDEATEDLGWGKESVGIMLKHYVGAGAIETGCDDHMDKGMYDTFPGDNYKAHLIPFLDGGLMLDSTTEQMLAVMPNYGIAWSEDGEYGDIVGGGFNKKQLSILRNAGWDGIFVTDWGIINTGRGTESMTPGQRYKMMIDAGVDQCGGSFDPEGAGVEALEALTAELGEDGALERLRESARRILKVMVTVDLFDQPYSDRSEAAKVFESEEVAAFSEEANERSVVMVKNAGGVISEAGLGDKPKVYIPQVYTEGSSGPGGTTPGAISLGLDEEVASKYFNVVTDTVGEPSGEPVDGEATYQSSDIIRADGAALADVDYALIRIRNPQDAYEGASGGKSLFGQDSGEPIVYRPVSLQYRPYTAEGDYVRKTTIAGDPADGSTWDQHDFSAQGVELASRDHFGKESHATNESDLDLVVNARENLPEGAKLILVIDTDHPMIFSEIEPYADVILMAWCCNDGSTTVSTTSSEAIARIVTGQAEPSGLLTYQMPANMETVETQLEDVPRDMEPYVDSEGNAYDFCFGLNWSGVIDDERVATYKANPLTEPETEVKADA